MRIPYNLNTVITVSAFQNTKGGDIHQAVILSLAYFPYFEKYDEYEITLLSVCLPCPKVARQWLSKHIPGITNTHATIKELLGALFSLQSMLYQILNM
jgi:hypothetical protein